MKHASKIWAVTIIAVIALLFPTAVHKYQLKHVKVTYKSLHPDIRKQVDCLADNIYFEAKGESREGQKAVAMVTMNRVKSKKYPRTVCGVVKQQDQFVCQFSWWCDPQSRYASLNRRVNKRVYDQVRNVALEVFLNYNYLKDITKGALFYHATYVPKQALGVDRLKVTAKIGQHIFYRT